MTEHLNGTVSWRLAQLERTVAELDMHLDKLGSKLDRVYWALVGASLTVSVSVIVFAVTFVSGKP